MRVAPSSSNPKSHSQTSASAPSAPGLHDTLRHGVGPQTHVASSTSAALPDSNHPLESRLSAWNATQESLKLNGLRRTFGISEPIRREMELKIVKEGEWRPAVLLGSTGLGGARQGSLHEDILRGRDATCDWEDVFCGGQELRSVKGFHDEVEARVKMSSQ